MDDLLQKFVELAPKEWHAKWDSEVHATLMTDDFSLYPIWLGNDLYSSKTLIFLLDWLEGNGHCWSIDNLGYGVPEAGEDRYRCHSTSKDGEGDHIYADGKTRIEAVLRAVVAILAERSVPA